MKLRWKKKLSANYIACVVALAGGHCSLNCLRSAHIVRLVIGTSLKQRIVGLFTSGCQMGNGLW